RADRGNRARPRVRHPRRAGVPHPHGREGTILMAPDTARLRTFSSVPFLIVAAVGVAGVVFRPAPSTVAGGPVNSGDTAWMLTAAALVLLMTPGLSFFYGGMVRTRNVVS